jgi:hypothetical protein
MIPSRFIASDPGRVRRGNRLTLHGAAIEFKEYQDFRNHYFKVVKEVCEKYNVKRISTITKFEDLIKLAPSYDLSDVVKELVTSLLSHNSVKEIHVCTTYLNEPVRTWKGSMLPTPFADKILSQYYPIVPIWRFYYDETRNIKYKPDNIILDDFQGKITKAWKFLGKEYEISTIPHGDCCYPALSTCDLLCSLIKISFPSLYIGDIKQSLIDLDVGDAYITAEFIGNKHEDFEGIVPTLPYRLRTEQHYPHPIVFIHGNTENKNKFKVSDAFRETLEFAEAKGGCVTFFDESIHSAMLAADDIVVCLEPEGLQEMETFRQLHRRRTFNVYDIGKFYEIIDKSKE